jgi:hypothetical protein
MDGGAAMNDDDQQPPRQLYRANGVAVGVMLGWVLLPVLPVVFRSANWDVLVGRGATAWFRWVHIGLMVMWFAGVAGYDVWARSAEDRTPISMTTFVVMFVLLMLGLGLWGFVACSESLMSGFSPG